MALEHESPWIDEKEIRAVPRWEVRQMIKECVVAEIGVYERTIVAPRHTENQRALADLTTMTTGFKDVLTELNGGVKVIKWLGGIVTCTVGLGGGIYAFARMFGHS